MSFRHRGRVLGIVALKDYLALDCEVQAIHLGRGDQLRRSILALNPDRKCRRWRTMVLCFGESNAILFYMAAKHPKSGLWPSDLQGQAGVLRWLAWESAHWDVESIGMVSYEKASKVVLSRGPSDPAFIARGEQNFSRFAAVLNKSLRGKTWLIGERLTIADFQWGGSCPQPDAWGFPSETSPKSVAGQKRPRCVAGLAGSPGSQGRGHVCLTHRFRVRRTNLRPVACSVSV